MLQGRNIQVAAQPINWINDDFRDLGAETTLEQCLTEMREAGYEGTELGHRFPSDSDALRALLQQFSLKLAGAWHSTYLATSPLDGEERRFDEMVELLRNVGCDVVVLAECTHAIHSDGSKPLRFQSGRDLLDDGAWERVYGGLEKLAQRAATHGMTAVYHPHMGTVVQDRSDVDALMERTRTLKLLLDTGHLTFAGADALAVTRDHGARIAHVHTKNVRPRIVEQAKAGGWSFEKAVRSGVFTVPGDGGIDYGPIFEELARVRYNGWLVVEAEQDPKIAKPLVYAKLGREHIRKLTGA